MDSNPELDDAEERGEDDGADIPDACPVCGKANADSNGWTCKPWPGFCGAACHDVWLAEQHRAEERAYPPDQTHFKHPSGMWVRGEREE